jgi:hypothetical protein
MDLIESISSRLGLSVHTAQVAVGSVLAMVRQHAPAELFAAVEEQAPETTRWMAAAQRHAPGEDRPPAVAQASRPGTALGGVVASLSRHGVSGDALGMLVPLVVQYLRAKVGDGAVARLLAAAPILPDLATALPTRSRRRAGLLD